MSKKRWILIILAILIWVASACFLLPWKIWDNFQNKTDVWVETNKEIKEEEEAIKDEAVTEDEVIKDNEGTKEEEVVKEEEEIKDLNIGEPEKKKFEENRREEPKSTEVDNSNNKEIKTQEDCPEWKVLRCPMWLCTDEETGESYPCQFRCFCVSPEMYF